MTQTRGGQHLAGPAKICEHVGQPSSPLPLSSTFLCSFNPFLALPASTFTRTFTFTLYRNLTLEPEIFPAATDSRYLRAVSRSQKGGQWIGSWVLTFPLIAPLVPCR